MKGAAFVTALTTLVACAPAAATAPTVATQAQDTARSASYAFLKNRNHNPRLPGAYWNPCRRSIRYGIDFVYAVKVGMNPAWEKQRWKSSLDELGRHLGIRFRYAGPIVTKAGSGRPLTSSDVDLVLTYGNNGRRGPYGYGSRFDGGVAGFGGSQWLSTGSRSEITSGFVVVDAEQVAKDTELSDQRPARPSDHEPAKDVLRALYMHELGHAVGLDHVSDPGQLMYPSLNSQRGDVLGGGDRTGLRRLGRQRCF